VKSVALSATSQAGSEITSPSNWGSTNKRFACNDGFSSAHEKGDKAQDNPKTTNDASKGVVTFNKLPLQSTHLPDQVDEAAEQGTLAKAPI
tara:strand:- start:154 stop:426 length:273 start_codon:yes stop_codon:yes gene_type:complete